MWRDPVFSGDIFDKDILKAVMGEKAALTQARGGRPDTWTGRTTNGVHLAALLIRLGLRPENRQALGRALRRCRDRGYLGFDRRAGYGVTPSGQRLILGGPKS